MCKWTVTEAAADSETEAEPATDECCGLRRLMLKL